MSESEVEVSEVIESEEINTVVELGGKSYDLMKTGFAQAQQVAGIGRWLSKHGAAMVAELSDSKEAQATSTNMDLVIKALGSFTAEALVDLFEVVTGCTTSVANKYFDIGILISGVIVLFDNPSIKRVIDRFFSGTG